MFSLQISLDKGNKYCYQRFVVVGEKINGYIILSEWISKSSGRGVSRDFFHQGHTKRGAYPP